VKDVLLKVGHWDSWSKLDLKSGFWQVPMDADSVPYTGCCTPDELFVWHRMPFGVRNGPPHFQRIMSTAIMEDGLADSHACFIDDLATGGHSHAQNAANAAALFAMLARRRLLAGADKVFLGLEELRFLGMLLRKGSMLPDPDKVQAV